MTTSTDLVHVPRSLPPAEASQRALNADIAIYLLYKKKRLGGGMFTLGALSR